MNQDIKRLIFDYSDIISTSLEQISVLEDEYPMLISNFRPDAESLLREYQEMYDPLLDFESATTIANFTHLLRQLWIQMKLELPDSELFMLANTDKYEQEFIDESSALEIFLGLNQLLQYNFLKIFNYLWQNYSLRIVPIVDMQPFIDNNPKNLRSDFSEMPLNSFNFLKSGKPDKEKMIAAEVANNSLAVQLAVNSEALNIYHRLQSLMPNELSILFETDVIEPAMSATFEPIYQEIYQHVITEKKSISSLNLTEKYSSQLIAQRIFLNTVKRLDEILDNEPDDLKLLLYEALKKLRVSIPRIDADVIFTPTMPKVYLLKYRELSEFEQNHYPTAQFAVDTFLHPELADKDSALLISSGVIVCSEMSIDLFDDFFLSNPERVNDIFAGELDLIEVENINKSENLTEITTATT